jgi:hypothetical protein
LRFSPVGTEIFIQNRSGVYRQRFGAKSRWKNWVKFQRNSTDERIRPLALPTNVVVAPPVNINDYMDNGPGRFVNAAAFEVMHKFFSMSQDIPPSPPGGYTKAELFVMFGMDGGGSAQLKRRAAFVDQSAFSDGKNDLLERAYIWQTTGFQIDDRARFFVGANGVRTVTNFGIVQYSAESADKITPPNTENFDFTGGGKLERRSAAARWQQNHCNTIAKSRRARGNRTVAYQGTGP